MRAFRDSVRLAGAALLICGCSGQLRSDAAVDAAEQSDALDCATTCSDASTSVSVDANFAPDGDNVQDASNVIDGGADADGLVDDGASADAAPPADAMEGGAVVADAMVDGAAIADATMSDTGGTDAQLPDAEAESDSNVIAATEGGTDAAVPFLCGSYPCQLYAAPGGTSLFAIAVNSTQVFVIATGGEDLVLAVPINGGAPTALAADLAAGLIAANNTDVYWTGGAIESVPAAGGAATTIGQVDSSFAIAIDATNVYWSEGTGAILSAPLAGGNRENPRLRNLQRRRSGRHAFQDLHTGRIGSARVSDPRVGSSRRRRADWPRPHSQRQPPGACRGCSRFRQRVLGS
jgi:hypothetical protein